MRKPTTRQIPLRNRAGETVAHALVDEEDYERVTEEGRWSLARRGYVYRKKTVARGKTVEVKLHRFIMGAGRGDPLVDHRDRDPLNNQRDNLRLCTNQENSTNRAGKAGTSRYRGVFWDAGVSKWRAQHTLNRQTVYIGIFPLEEDAAEAARLWRTEHMPFSTEEAA